MSRLVDIALALSAAICLSPLVLLIAVAVRLDLGSPVLFRQRRAGLGGIEFDIVKFRTMRDTRDSGGRLLPDAERVVPLGRLLRRTRLDELPELLNILRGDMSFVGPRPLLPETIRVFGEKGVLRGRVRPGLTGWSQVNGNTLLTQEEKLELDLWYLANRTLFMDAAVMLRTLAVMTFGEQRNSDNLEKAFASSRHRRG